ncbi:universal stress protein [Aeromicrobium sp.]
MSEEEARPPIVVGVRDGEHPALAYAISRARQLGCEVRVVHAYYVPPSTYSDYALDVAAGFEARGNEVLAAARSQVESLEPAVNVHYVLTRGHASPVLLEESANAGELVLGPDNSTWVSRLFEGEVCRSVVSKAKCAVVVVPERPNASDARHEVVLAAGEEPPTEGPLQYAFAMASESEAPLRVLRVAPRGTTDPENEQLSISTSRLLEGWKDRHRGVAVELTIVCGDASSQIRLQTESASMVVVGRSSVSRVPHVFDRPFEHKMIVKPSCPIAVVPPHLP